MNIYTKYSIIAVLSALGAACSQSEEPLVEVEKAVDKATQVTQKAGSDAMVKATEAGDEVMNASKSAMEDAQGQVGEVMDDAEEMAKEAVDDAMQEVEGMSEEDLKDQAKNKLGLNR